jgi:hypothetical protein
MDEPSPAQGMLHSVWGRANPEPGTFKLAVPPSSFPQKHSLPHDSPASLKLAAPHSAMQPGTVCEVVFEARKGSEGLSHEST